MVQQIRVLHVDDEPGFADIAATYIEREDERFSVATATSASEGLDRLSAERFDCIVSDYDMPRRNGLEFLDLVRDDNPGVPFILYTGKGSEEIASRAISAGVTDYLQKGGGPDQYTVLANRIENAVDRYASERELRRWKRAIETANEGIAIVDADGQFVQMNDAYADAYDESPDALVGTNWRQWYPDDEVRQFEEVVFPELRRDGTRVCEAVGSRSDGTRFEQHLSLSTLDDGGHVCILEDSTERKRRERELRRVKQEYQTVFENVQDLLFLYDVDGSSTDPTFRLRRLNPALKELFGLSNVEVQGRTPTDLYGAEMGQAFVTNYERCLDVGEAISYEEELSIDGETRVFEITLSPVTIDDEIANLVGVGHEITERKELEQKLETVRERMEFVLDATDSYIYEVDIETGSETRHGAFERIHNLEPATVPTTEQFYERAVHPDDRDRVYREKRVKGPPAPSETVSVEFRTNPENGEVRWIHSEAYVQTGPDGDPEKLFGLATDVTDHR